MRNIVFLLFVLALCSQIQKTNAVQRYFLWNTCQDELKAFSLWIYQTSPQQLLDQRYLMDCLNYNSSPEDLIACEKQITSKYGLDKVVLDFFDSCYVKRAKFYETHPVDFEKCEPQSNQCFECLINKSCQTFKKSNYARWQEYQRAISSTQPGECEQLKECYEPIGIIAQSECMYYQQEQCRINWLFSSAQDDSCLPYQICNPYESTNTTEYI